MGFILVLLLALKLIRGCWNLIQKKCRYLNIGKEKYKSVNSTVSELVVQQVVEEKDIV